MLHVNRGHKCYKIVWIMWCNVSHLLAPKIACYEFCLAHFPFFCCLSFSILFPASRHISAIFYSLASFFQHEFYHFTLVILFILHNLDLKHMLQRLSTCLWMLWIWQPYPAVIWNVTKVQMNMMILKALNHQGFFHTQPYATPHLFRCAIARVCMCVKGVNDFLFIIAIHLITHFAY